MCLSDWSHTHREKEREKKNERERARERGSLNKVCLVLQRLPLWAVWWISASFGLKVGNGFTWFAKYCGSQQDLASTELLYFCIVKFKSVTMADSRRRDSRGQVPLMRQRRGEIELTPWRHPQRFWQAFWAAQPSAPFPLTVWINYFSSLYTPICQSRCRSPHNVWRHISCFKYLTCLRRAVYLAKHWTVLFLLTLL